MFLNEKCNQMNGLNIFEKNWSTILEEIFSKSTLWGLGASKPQISGGTSPRTEVNIFVDYFSQKIFQSILLGMCVSNFMIVGQTLRPQEYKCINL